MTLINKSRSNSICIEIMNIILISWSQLKKILRRKIVLLQISKIIYVAVFEILVYIEYWRWELFKSWMKLLIGNSDLY